MSKLSVTTGEQLFDSVSANVHDFRDFADRFGSVLQVTRRKRHLSGFFHALLTLSATTRLIRYGRFLLEFDPEEADQSLRQKVLAFARDKLLIHSENCSDPQEVVELTLIAARKSKRPITNAHKALIETEFPEPSCYLCGIALSYTAPPAGACVTCGKVMADRTQPEAVSYEHIWPAAYGGDTTVANLLPACRWCNADKDALASWQWASIAATLLPNSPGTDDWKQLRRREKIAMTMRAAWDIAVSERKTLRDALLKVGPYRSFHLIDSEDSADFFNMRTHDLESLGLDWSLA
jgi:hypothetical protein